MFITVDYLTAVTPSLASTRPAELDAAVAYANDMAASLIGRQYTLPLSVVPSSVKGACVDIARRRVNLFTVEDAIQSAHDAAMRWLRDIANGVAVLILPNDPTTSPDESTRPGVFSGGQALTYSRRALGRGTRSFEL